MSRGHIPLRSCVVCGEKTDKRDLIRIVRTKTGQVEVDATSRVPGRGAYLCHRQACWDSALKKNRLDHKLRGPISPDNRLILREFARQMTDAPQADGEARLQNSIV